MKIVIFYFCNKYFIYYSSEVSRARSCESSFTAASLIDAIITHQINQSSDAQGSTVPPGTNLTPQTQSTRPGDRLFQV